MKIAFVSSTVRGEIDRLLSRTADTLLEKGTRISGVVKILGDAPEEAHDCDMDLRVLPDGPAICITQSLGEGSSSCRLNPAGISQAVAAVEQGNLVASEMFILNKFGPQEAEGHGFCAAIGAALERDIPVLVGVGLASREAFDRFADGLAEPLAPDARAILEWCETAIAQPQGNAAP